jgi:hypothetical protein
MGSHSQQAQLAVSPRGARSGLSALVIAVALLLCAPAFAAGPAPHGALTALAGRGGCLGHDCAPLRGFARAPRNATSSTSLTLELGASGRTVYATGGDPEAVAILARDLRTGALRQLSGQRGCIVTRAEDGCAVAPQLAGRVATVAPNGATISVAGYEHPFRTLTLARDSRTGRVHALAGGFRCRPAVDAGCFVPRGIGSTESVLTGDPARTILTAYLPKPTQGAGIAVTRRGADGRLHQVAGTDGCATSTGQDGCAEVPCMTEVATAVAVSRDGRYLYLAGGNADLESTADGYLATFRRLSDGGLRPVGCVLTAGAGVAAENVPIWLASLPHGDTVLELIVRGNRGDGIVYGRIDGSTPAPNGVLGTPIQLSSDLNLTTDVSLALAPDGRTLYTADDTGGGNLDVLRVSPSAAAPLPGRYGTPYIGGAARSSHDYAYGATDMLRSRDGRFVYLATGSIDTTEDRSTPGIRVYRVAR